MKVRTAKNIGSIWVIALLLASTFVIIVNSSYADSSSISATESTSSDVSAASGSNRFVVWQDVTPGNNEILFRRSTDNGATWQATKNLSTNPGPSLVPQIVVSGSNVYVVWLQLNSDDQLPNIFFRRSTDNGATWGAKIKISTSGTVGFENQFSLDASGSNVYVVWKEDGDFISFRRSTDNGATWKSITNLNTHAKFNTEVDLAVSGSNVYVVWTSTGKGALFTRSTNNGATWGSDINISGDSAPAMCPRVAASGTFVYVAWQLSFNGAGCNGENDDIIFRRSSDNGATWKAKINLSNSPDFTMFHQIVASGSNVHVVWVDHLHEVDHSFTGGEIFIRSSSNNGASWNSVRNLSSNPGNSVHPDIATSGSSVYVAWVQFNTEGETGELPNIFIKRSTNNGATWATKINLSNTGQGVLPVVAATGLNVYVAWTDSSTGNDEIFFKRSTNNGASWTSAENLSSNSGTSHKPRIGV